MEVSDRIAVINEGRVEQVGKPRDLYEHPTNEFVMTFIGPVSRLGDGFVRPHDIELALQPNGSTRSAQVTRIVHLGFEVRVELVLPDGERLWAQTTRRDVEALALDEGMNVFVRPSRTHTFEDV